VTPSVLDRQDALIRAMTPEQKIRASQALYAAAWDLKAAWLRSLDPELTEKEVQDRVRRLFRDTGS
jgi:hypothetical protein